MEQRGGRAQLGPCADRRRRRYLRHSGLDAPTRPGVRKAGGHASDGFTPLYTLNDRESDVAALERDGAGVSVLGQLDYWLHVSLEGEGMFMLMENAELSDEADALLYDLLPDRFSGTTRIQYDHDRNLNRLLSIMASKYGENVPVEFWSVEDKAWYGQLEEMYLGSHDHYYILPGEDDLPLEEAEQLALDAYAEALGDAAVPADELDLYSGFYRLGYSEPVYWSVYICEKGTHNILWSVELDGKTGEPKG